MSLKIAIGSDHHGVAVRVKIAGLLAQDGYSVAEFGPSLQDTAHVDYPDIAVPVSQLVSSGEADRGILICGTGIGMSITANKFSGVRAAPVIDELSAELSRRHNDLNVICLSGEMLNEETIVHILQVWLTTPFDGDRHERRVHKIAEIEKMLGLAAKT
ncbi:MAG: ribose 5-phosphate isomerase B [Planctomycetaceae bacterium]|nr:ribose 5-phosphate isomerase B [Planctomycetaceae bacterium]